MKSNGSRLIDYTARPGAAGSTGGLHAKRDFCPGSPDLRREYGHHQSAAIRAGGLIFCSSMVAINPETGEREHGTVTSEAQSIFENLKLLLESAARMDREGHPHNGSTIAWEGRPRFFIDTKKFNRQSNDGLWPDSDH
jgi:hypothetical protein